MILKPKRNPAVRCSASVVRRNLYHAMAKLVSTKYSSTHPQIPCAATISSERIAHPSVVNSNEERSVGRRPTEIRRPVCWWCSCVGNIRPRWWYLPHRTKCSRSGPGNSGNARDPPQHAVKHSEGKQNHDSSPRESEAPIHSHGQPTERHNAERCRRREAKSAFVSSVWFALVAMLSNRPINRRRQHTPAEARHES